MTSDTTPSGEASASSYYTGYEAYKAFSDGSGAGWYVNTAAFTGNYIEYAFDTAVTARSVYAVILQNGSQVSFTFTLKGSNTGTDWDTTADTIIQNAVAYNSLFDVTKTIIPLSNTKAYKYYRWYVTASTITTASSGIKLNLLG